MKKTLTILTTFYFILFINYCSENTTKPDPPQPVVKDSISISLEQVTHRSISLRLMKKLQMKNDQYVVNRIADGDTFSFFIFPLSSADTLVIDDNAGLGLTLDTEYSYFAYRLDSTGAPIDTSNFLIARTLPATSHDFSWTEYNIGNWQSELRDVWGTSPDNVYAVGSITIDDTGYGMAYWDGSTWTPNQDAGGNSIYGFSDLDIWTAGVAVSHKEGSEWKRVSHDWIDSELVVYDQTLFDNTPYTSIWGTSSENLYFGSQKGTIVHWNGEKGSLENLQAKTFIRGIWGFSENNIYACAGTVSGSRESQLFHYNGNEWKLIIESDLSQEPGKLVGAFYSLWGIDASLLYMSGDRIHTFINGTWTSLRLGFFTDKIRGQQSNDIIAAGQFGGVAHYNEVDWKIFTELPVARETNLYKSAWFVNDQVFLVGENQNGGAIIVHGIKN